MVGRITAPLGFVNKPKLIREGRAASCVLRPPSAKELQTQGTRPTAQTPSNTPKPKLEKQEPPGSPSERDRDSQQQWCDVTTIKQLSHTLGWRWWIQWKTNKSAELRMEPEGIQILTSFLNNLFWGPYFNSDSFFQTFSKTHFYANLVFTLLWGTLINE